MSTIERLARDRWNAQADEYNQWDTLGGDERAELIDAEYRGEMMTYIFRPYDELPEYINEDKMNYEKVSRVEVIDNNGRAYTQLGVVGMTFDLQDDGQTLKIFVTSDPKKEKEIKEKMFNEMIELRQILGLKLRDNDSCGND